MFSTGKITFFELQTAAIFQSATVCGHAKSSVMKPLNVQMMVELRRALEL